MGFRKSFPFKVFTSILISIILFTNTSYSQGIIDTLATPNNVFEAKHEGKNSPTPASLFSPIRDDFKDNVRQDMKTLIYAIFFFEQIRPWDLSQDPDKSKIAFETRILAALKKLRPLNGDEEGKQLLEIELEKDKIKRIGDKLEGLEIPFGDIKIHIFRKKEIDLSNKKGWEELGDYCFRTEKRTQEERASDKDEKEREKMKLSHQVKTPDQIYEPKKYAEYSITKQILNSNFTEAVRIFLTNNAAKSSEDFKDIAARLSNRFLESYSKDVTTEILFRGFVAELNRAIFQFMPDTEDDIKTAQDLQLITGQALTIMSWINRKVPGAKNIRVTIDTAKMVSSSKGESFLDKTTLPEGAEEVKAEGDKGFFWRGIEGVKKLGSNILETIIKVNSSHYERLQAMKDKMVLYLMDHGFIAVPEGLKAATDEKRISTMHETVFLNDLLPLSNQRTSTGPGHFQANNLDIKYVTRGTGTQVNVLYNEYNEIVDVIVQQLEAGTWAVALPGYVDYMINRGGLQFNDMSVALTDKEVRVFNPNWDKLKAAGIKPSIAPVMAIVGTNIKEDTLFVRKAGLAVNIAITEIHWDAYSKVMGKKMSLIDLYQGKLSEGKRAIEKTVKLLLEAKNIAFRARQPIKGLYEEKDLFKGELKEKPVSLGKIKGVESLILDNEDFLASVFADKTKPEKLLRIAVETIEQNEGSGIKELIRVISDSPNFQIQLYSVETPELEVQTETYDKYGIVKVTTEDLKGKTKENTLTILPVEKGEEFSPSEKNVCWGKLGSLTSGVNCTPKDTIVLPVGYNFDQAGFVRSIVLGLRLSEIAEKKYDVDHQFVSDTFEQYEKFCLSQGADPKEFTLTKEDIFNMAGIVGIKAFTLSLNSLIRALPIVPFNIEEIRAIHERAKEAMIRA